MIARQENFPSNIKCDKEKYLTKGERRKCQEGKKNKRTSKKELRNI